MTQDRASLVISEEDERTVLAAIAQIEAVLKNLTAFEAGEHKGMQFMGTRNAPFARATHELLQQNRDLVPPSLDLDAMRADFEAYDRMQRINVALQRLTRMCADTEAALGSDALDAALSGYTMLKVFGPSHGLGDAVKALSERFARQGPRKPKSEG